MMRLVSISIVAMNSVFRSGLAMASRRAFFKLLPFSWSGVFYLLESVFLLLVQALHKRFFRPHSPLPQRLRQPDMPSYAL